MACRHCEERTSHKRLGILQLDSYLCGKRLCSLPVLQNPVGKVGWRNLSFLLSLTQPTGYVGAEIKTRTFNLKCCHLHRKSQFIFLLSQSLSVLLLTHQSCFLLLTHCMTSSNKNQTSLLWAPPELPSRSSFTLMKFSWFASYFWVISRSAERQWVSEDSLVYFVWAQIFEYGVDEN